MMKWRYFVSRISDFINYGTIKLSTAEIEAVIEFYSLVLKVAVVSVPYETDEEHSTTFI
jgi:acyl-coenzyme A synthetase/AMP-(fatty) acid ligase